MTDQEPTLAPKEQLAFISYRRQDSSAAARWLLSTVQRCFGPSSAFMDTEAIRMGDDWSERIDNALIKATVVIAVIGPQWLRIADDYGRRRIDKGGDWVRREIAHAIANRVNLIPILLSNTPKPDREALPEELSRLPKYQSFQLSDETWEQDIALVVSRLAELGFKRAAGRTVQYPVPRIRIRDLTPEELDAALDKLPGWEVTLSDLPGYEPLKRTEIRRVYEFASFEDAMAFMNAASQHISRVDHHPRWENIWRTVTVWLSTWDIGHRVSKLDLELAEHLNELRKQYPQPRKRRVSG